MSTRIVLLGDSRTFGAGDPAAADYLGQPGPTASFGAGFTSPPQASLTGGSGAGGQVSAINTPSGELAFGVIVRGSGYHTTVPTISTAGGGGTGGDFSFNNGPAGGYLLPLENALNAAGHNVYALNCGINGAHVLTFQPGNHFYLAGVLVSAQAAQSSLVSIDLGINDALNLFPSNTYHDQMNAIVSALVTNGYPVILDKPFYINPGFVANYVQVNALLDMYAAQIDIIVQEWSQSYPNRVFLGADLRALITANASYLSDGLHPGAAGDLAIGAAKANVYGPIIAKLLRGK